MNDAAEVKRAVDWKIFEIQAGLISNEASERYMKLGMQWLQPRHFEEIIDERVSDGRCGYPLCLKSFQQGSSYQSVRHLYSKQKFDTDSQNYCSSTCCERGDRYLKSLDESSPLTRKVISSLDLSEQGKESENINAVLAILSEPPPAASRPKSAGVKEKTSISKSPSTDPSTRTGFITESPRSNDQLWAEKNPPTTNSSSTLPIHPPPPPLSLGSVQSLYLPTLLSYDPIQSVTPGHTSLVDSSRPSSSSDSQESEKIQNGNETRPMLKSSLKRGTKGPQTEAGDDPIAPKILSLPVPEVDIAPEKSKPVIQSRHLKKSLSFGQDAVRVFRRGSYVKEQFTESEWEEVKLQKSEPPKSEPISNIEDDSDDEDYPVYFQGPPPQPTFQSQVQDWLSNWGPSQDPPSHGSSQLTEPTVSESQDSLISSIKEIPPSYSPPEAKKEIEWVEPKKKDTLPTPPIPSLSAEQSKKAIQEAREKRKKGAAPVSSSKIMKSKVIERTIPNSASPAPKLQNGKSHDSSIEGYSPVISRDQIRVSPQTSLSGLAIQPFQMKSEEDTDETRYHDEQIMKEIEEYKASRVTVTVTVTPEGSLPLTAGVDLGEEDKVEREEEEEQEEEMDSIVKQNFFLYMWTCLEDLFGYEVISWMNDLEDHHTLTPEDQVEDEEGEDGESHPAAAAGGEEREGGDGEDEQTRQILNVSSLHHDTSILKHLNRGINHVEKILQIHSFLLKYYLNGNGNGNNSQQTQPQPHTAMSHEVNIYHLYLQQKKKLFSFLRLDDSFNPSFNQKQWIFLSLLIIDALLCKKIFLEENLSSVGKTSVFSIPMNEILENWNHKFNAYAAGILGGAGANEILDERQILNLRQFFSVD